MRYLSVCSGIEAATVAWHPLGWTPVGLSEIDPSPRAVLKRRLGAQAVGWDHRYNPESNVLPLFGDFSQIQEHHVGPVDLLVGGTPCQSFSVAGKRLGLDDPRGNLAIEFLALAKRVRARWIVWENVPGVLSSWSGEPPMFDGRGLESGERRVGEFTETGDFHAFLELFRECGYRGCYRVLDAQYVRVDGLGRAVPQRRRRVFVVGHLGDDNRATAVLLDREGLRGDPAPRRQPGQGFARDIVPSLTGSSVGARRAGETRGQDPVIAERHGFGGNDTRGPIDVAAKVGAHHGHGDFETETFIAEAITFPEFMSGTQDVAEHPTSNALQATNPTAIAFNADILARSGEAVTPSADAEGRIRLRPPGVGIYDDGSMFSLTAGQPHAVAFSCKDHGQDATDNVAPTLRGMQSGKRGGGGPNGGGQVAVALPDVANSLTAGMGASSARMPMEQGALVPEVSAPLGAGTERKGWRDDLDQGAFIPMPVAFDETQLTHPANHSSPKPGDPCHPLASGARPPAIAFQERGREGGRSVEAQNDVAYALTSPEGGGRRNEINVAFAAKSVTVSENSNGFAWESDVAPAVQAQSPNPEANTFSGVTDGWVVRRLTVRECERLQGFPDDWTLIPYGSRTKMEPDMFAYLKATYPDLTLDEAALLAADAPRYKSIGNAMPVNTMRWIGRRIQYVERLVGAKS